MSGAPGETIQVHDGDLYVNGKLCRKTLEEAHSMRVLLFDQACPPADRRRWEFSPSSPPAPLPEGERGELRIDGRLTPQTATYRHILDGAAKCEPIRD